jgi:HSP90 family molecular chaperone
VKEDDSGEPLKRGTRVTLHLKEDAYELADEKKLAELIKQYSEFIQFPIRYDQHLYFPKSFFDGNKLLVAQEPACGVV